MDTATADVPIQILIVDDEINILKSLKRLLMSEDYEILTSNSGEEALKILSENPDLALIISDQRMPGLTGVEFLEKASQIAPQATRMILTGYADVKAAIDGINRGGAYRYITKPWKDDELLHVVNEAVLRFALIKDNQRLTEIVKKQNNELKNLNSNLTNMVEEQTLEIQNQNDELKILNERLKNNFKATIMAFSNLMELRDRNAVSHSRNVADLSVKVARLLNLNDEETQDIAVASLLHDIGKIGITDDLLRKDMDELNFDEKKVYSQHPVRGQTAIDSIEDLREIGIIIRHHHEQFDGNGFPDGLSGKRIPLGSRIIILADFIDRNIRKFSGEKAFEFILNQVKSELDRKFDGELIPLIESPIRDTYADILQKNNAMEKEIQPKNLRAGMVLSRDVRSGTGLLIVRSGTVIGEKNIESIKRSYRLDPAKYGVFILVEGR